ncbi:MAG: flagellar protein FlbB [Spirochaetaceae bacterium]|jgi:flagellar protein FlbB|nr:flagellar protein FlbB [Spirochaetaceae bacterium]
MARTLLLLLLIAVVVAGGLVWFDYLNVLDIKTVLSPAYKLLGLEGRSQPDMAKNEILDLNNERLAVRLEALDLRSLELDKKELNINDQEAQLAQVASELEDRQKGLDEREKSMTAQEDMNAVKNKNIERNARNLNGMPPQNAVAIIAAMDDQDAIDVLLKTEEIAKEEGSASIVPFWLSLMDAQRAADLQRKMAERPN